MKQNKGDNMKENKELIISCITNLSLFIFKLVGGILCKSSSFIADSMHSCSIFISDSMNIYNKEKERNDKLYYINVAAGLFILFIGFGIIYNVLGRKYYLPKSQLFIFCSIAIFVKLVLSLYLMYSGQNKNNQALSLSAYNSRLDVISSLIVLFGTMIMRIFSSVKFLRYIDMISTFIIGLIVINIGYNYLKEVISFKIGTAITDEDLISDIKKNIIKNKNVIEIDEIIILRIGDYYKIVGSLEMNGQYSLIEVHDIICKIEKKLKQEFKDIRDVTIKVNPYRRVL